MRVIACIRVWLRFCVDEETLTYALERDVTVLQRRGELIETIPATPFH